MDMLDLVLPELEPATEPEPKPIQKTYNQYQRESKRHYRHIMKRYGAKVYKSEFDTIKLPSETLFFNGQALSHEAPHQPHQTQLFQP